MALRYFTAVILCASMFAGCGGDSSKNFSGEQHRVAQALEDMQHASKKGDAKKICQQLLSRKIIASFKSHRLSCVEQFSSVIKNSEKLDVTVKRVKVDGARAKATVQTKVDGKNQVTTVSLVKEVGRWRVDTLDR